MKVLYSQSSQLILFYPRHDDSPVVGLDNDFVTIEKVYVDQPSYDPDTQQLTERWVIDLEQLEYRQNWTITDIVNQPLPNWDGFNAAMLANTEFNQITGLVLSLAPAVALGMPAALAQVSANGVTAFALVFGAFCQIGNVSSEQREVWANIAEGFNLPIEFISVVRN